MKILQLEAELFHADGQTDSQTWRCLSQFCERA